MAVNLSIKGVPDTFAECDQRSPDGGLAAIVSEAVKHGPAPVEAARADDHGGTRVGWRTTADIAAELRRRFPVPLDSGPLRVDIIRADRDSR